MMDKEALEYFRKKIRISMLGEPSYISQAQVIELCKKFFQYGLEYNKKS
jgi:hypothetical protein